MKSIHSKLFGLICCSLLLLSGAWNAEAQNNKINIQDYSSIEHSRKDSIKHKFKDLEIFKLTYSEDTLDMGENAGKAEVNSMYEFCIWAGDKEAPRSITFFEMNGAEDDIDKVTYNWESDSLLLITVKSKSKKDLTFEFFGDVLYLKETGGPAVRIRDNNK